MLNICLNSIYDNFNKLPHIYIFTDPSLKSAACKEAISWFPEINISIIDSTTCLAYHESKRTYLLEKFASQNPMGLKLAALLQTIDLGNPVLYSDTDVIWSKDPLPDLKKLLENPNFHLALSSDFQPSYDNNLITTCNLTDLYKPPYFCAGIIFINKLAENHYKLIESLLPVVISHSDHFSEQTIFASLNKQSGSFILDNSKFIIDLDDKVHFCPNKKSEIIARHYVGAIRHLFWRDAMFDQLRIKTPSSND